MGAVINMRPDLFNSAILGVPFVDCLTTMLDETIPLTGRCAGLPASWPACLPACLPSAARGCPIDPPHPVIPHPRPPPSPMSAVIEWEEWGNPADPEFYDYMKVRLLL